MICNHLQLYGTSYLFVRKTPTGQITVPEIGATASINSTRLSDAIDTAHRLIGEYLRQQVQALRDHVNKAIKRGGSYTDDDITAILVADEEQEDEER